MTTLHDTNATTTDDNGKPPKQQALLLKGSSFRVEKGVNMLKLCGSPYQMGYQHGYLLADRIRTMVTKTVLALPAFIASLTGQSLEESMEWALQGQRDCEPFLPDECREEMEGIVDGAHAAGVTDIGLSQVLLWNTYYDQWCLYCHPHYWKPQLTSSTFEAQQECCEGGRVIFGSAGGCSSFSAWGKGAGGEGRLIFGKNEDNFNMPFQLENRIMVIAKPSYGYGHVFMTYPGLIGLDGGMNAAGFEMMTHLNSMKDESMQGCGIAIFTRLLLTHVSTVQGALEMLKKYPRCAGIAYHVVDAKAKQAAIIETSATKVSVRHPKPGSEALWQANHSNCFPGWEGYNGYNMVEDQKLVNQLKDVSTVEAWQNSLRDPSNEFVQAPSRFERYRELLERTHYGKITPEAAIDILSDRTDPYANNRVRALHEPSVSNNVLCTICALYPNMQFHAPQPLGDFQATIANNWSLVAYPETGDFWLAIKDFPAQYGGFEHFNLHDLLV